MDLDNSRDFFRGNDRRLSVSDRRDERFGNENTSRDGTTGYRGGNNYYAETRERFRPNTFEKNWKSENRYDGNSSHTTKRRDLEEDESDRREGNSQGMVIKKQPPKAKETTRHSLSPPPATSEKAQEAKESASKKPKTKKAEKRSSQLSSSSSSGVKSGTKKKRVKGGVPTAEPMEEDTETREENTMSLQEKEADNDAAESFELLRVSPEERMVRTLRDVVPHISDSLLGEELSSNIIKLMAQYLNVKAPQSVIPFGVDQELEKVFVDSLLVRLPHKNGQRSLNPPDTITADSDWELRTMMMLKSPEELEALVNRRERKSKK
jgi:hypothetical protein